MDKKIYEEIKAEIKDFRIKANSYANKEISLKDFKGYSGGFGSYGERGGNSFMIRLRMNQGCFTKDKMNFVIESAKNYAVKKLHFTTCETIQLHGLTADATADIMAAALDHDIVCRGGGGDFPRNVQVNPLSGVDKTETFDVMPYAKAAADYLLSIMLGLKLPRKLKVVFENSCHNTVHATFRDLGFIANNDNTFAVYCAGGLGQNPKMGVQVATSAKPNQVLYYIKAMIDTFIENGNYTNRTKARTRYMQETLGIEGLKAAYNKHLTAALAAGGLDINPEIKRVTKVGETTDIKNWRLIEQKQPGLYAVLFHPIGGDIKEEELETLYKTILPMDDVEVRIGPDQNIYVINLTGKEAEAVLKVTEFAARNVFETSVSCVGATICQVGLRDSNGTLVNLIESLRQDGDLSDYLPRIHVSGCPSSCGTHQIGLIGFQGSFKLVEKKPEPAFIISINGNDKLGKEVFGETLGTILQKDIYPFFKELATELKVKQMSFKDFVAVDNTALLAILNKYIN